VDISPGAPQTHGAADASAATSGCAHPISNDADGAIVSDTTNGARAEELPRRQTPDRQVRKIRRLDDPEILERVLAGLLNLH